jgi:hypothetical protein
MALRAYIRKVRRLSEAQTERGRTLWQSVLELLRKDELVPRERVLTRFQLDGELSVSAVLHDLVESGLVFSSGAGSSVVYRAASEQELGSLAKLSDDHGLDELAWAMIFRHGPLPPSKLEELLRLDARRAAEVVERLRTAGRVQASADGRLSAREFVIPLGASAGWEAAVFDHLQAVVQTICQKLGQAPSASPEVGGSTYTFDIWPGHPLEQEVSSQLPALRARLSELRQRVERHNTEQGRNREYREVVMYLGQCAMERENAGSDEAS